MSSPRSTSRAPALEYGMTTFLANKSLDEARAAVIATLKEEGFGVLTEIDVKATLKQKLDHDFRPYVILGACNPVLAEKALTHELGIGLVLPCNVCVWEEQGGAVVAAIKPDAMFRAVNAPGVEEIAAEADARLRRAIEKLG